MFSVKQLVKLWRGMSMGSTAVRRLNDYVSALSYWRKKNKTKLGGSCNLSREQIEK